MYTVRLYGLLPNIARNVIFSILSLTFFFNFGCSFNECVDEMLNIVQVPRITDWNFSISKSYLVSTQIISSK